MASAAPLTVNSIKGIVPDAIRRREYQDGSSNLWLVVQPKTGTKSWVFRGSAKGEEFKSKLGRFPELTLADARRAHDDLRVRISKGDFLPPKALAARQASTKAAITVEDAWTLFMASDAVARNSEREIASKQAFYRTDIGPVIGSKALTAVSFDDIAGIIVDRYDTVREAKGGNGASANRLHSCLSKFLNWCAYDTVGRVRTGLDQNPMGRMKPPTSNGKRERALAEWELRYLFGALPAAGAYAGAFEMLLRTICRRSDIMGLDWKAVGTDEILFDRTKNGLPHWIYVTDSARALLGQRPEKGTGSAFGVSAEGCSNPMRRVREKMKELAEKDGKEIAHWTLHDFRRSAIDYLAGLLDENHTPLFDLECRELLLAHKRKGIEAHYQVNGLRAQRKRALIMWNAHLDKLKSEAVT